MQITFIGHATLLLEIGGARVLTDPNFESRLGLVLPRVTAPTLVIGGGNDHFYTPELFGGTAAGVQDGRVHIFPGWGHLRAASSTATAHLTLGFLLAGIAIRPGP